MHRIGGLKVQVSQKKSIKENRQGNYPPRDRKADLICFGLCGDVWVVQIFPSSVVGVVNHKPVRETGSIEQHRAAAAAASQFSSFDSSRQRRVALAAPVFLMLPLFSSLSSLIYTVLLTRDPPMPRCL